LPSLDAPFPRRQLNRELRIASDSTESFDPLSKTIRAFELQRLKEDWETDSSDEGMQRRSSRKQDSNAHSPSVEM
jgi:hypothetical protein